MGLSINGCEGFQATTDHWYLMECDWPALNWARLRVFADGHAEVLDIDGRILTFADAITAHLDLREDEYVRFADLTAEDEPELGRPLASIRLPHALDDATLVAMMRQAREPK